MSDVKFIRKNGRIIPIKSDGSNGQRKQSGGNSKKRTALLKNTNYTSAELDSASNAYNKVAAMKKYQRKATVKERLSAGAFGAAFGGIVGGFVAGKYGAAAGAATFGALLAKNGTRETKEGQRAAARASYDAIIKMREKKKKAKTGLK